jgi:hypothetical protein
MRASRWRRSLVAVVTAGLLGFGTSGCTSSDDPPAPAPLPTESPSPTESLADEPPSIPAKVRGKSARAAKAFARYYFDSVNLATRTGDTTQLARLGSEDCESCGAIVGNIDTIYSGGGSIESDGWHLDVATLVPGQPASSPILDLGVTQAPESVIASAGAEPEKFPGGKQPMTMYLSRKGGTWTVTQLDLVS